MWSGFAILSFDVVCVTHRPLAFNSTPFKIKRSNRCGPSKRRSPNSFEMFATSVPQEVPNHVHQTHPLPWWRAETFRPSERWLRDSCDDQRYRPLRKSFRRWQYSAALRGHKPAAIWQFPACHAAPRLHWRAPKLQQLGCCGGYPPSLSAPSETASWPSLAMAASCPPGCRRVQGGTLKQSPSFSVADAWSCHTMMPSTSQW